MKDENTKPLSANITVGQESVAHDRNVKKTSPTLPVGQESIAHDRAFRPKPAPKP